MNTIYFDLDGTLADLYGVPNWLPKLRSNDPSPYTQAIPLTDLRWLARRLNLLQKMGYRLGVISWLSKDSNPLYDEVVRKRKINWLKRHLGSVQWDEVHIVKYGTPKHLTAKEKGILFDDNEAVRQDWENFGGFAFDETDIHEVLKGLL